MSQPTPSAPLWPSGYYPTNWSQIKKTEFDQLCNIYEIHQDMASEVRCILSGQEKIIIIDNSGSQNWAIKPGNTEIVHHDGSPVARYEEAREFLRMVYLHNSTNKAVSEFAQAEGLTYH